MLTFFKTKKKIVFQEKTLDRIKAGNKIIFLTKLTNKHLILYFILIFTLKTLNKN